MFTPARIRELARRGAPALLLAAAIAAPADDEGKLLPDGAGKDQVVKICFDCHGAGNFRKLRLGSEAWAEQVADMTDRGAKGTEAELTAIVDYLTKSFGTGSKVNINTAPLIELKAQLGLSVKESQAVIDYREANGKFQTLADIAKVPGLESAKIEAAKDRIAF